MSGASSSPPDSPACRDARSLGIEVFELVVTDTQALRAAGGLLSELRGTSEKAATTFLREASREGYHVLLGWPAHDLGPQAAVGMAGFRVLTTSRGKLLLLEDLVVSGSHRGRGLGSVLIAHLRELAQRTACARIELDTGVTNKRAQHFYAGEGFASVAVHMATGIGHA
nr:GNAT family N-acetyltransferase [uncultured Nocardioides sp.]